VPYRYVLTNVWFASADTMRFVKTTLDKDFIMPFKRNRTVALSQDEVQAGRVAGVESVVMQPHAVGEVYVEDVDVPLVLSDHVLTNEDGSTAL
jgi:hypothetical protein